MECPMSKEQLDGLFAYLHEEGGIEGCDGTLAKSKAYLRRNGLPVKECTEWLQSQGGFCDCEVLLNVMCSE